MKVEDLWIIQSSMKTARHKISKTHKIAGRLAKSTLVVIVKKAKRSHHHVAKRPHNYLVNKFSLYSAWHQHRHHRKVHFAVLASYTVFVLVFTFGALEPTYAATSWAQSDWSGGVGASTVNQYSSATGITISGTNKVEMTSTSGWSSTYGAWAKRKPITITNSNGALTAYQVKLAITYDADMKVDFGDLRFANTSGTALDYWVQAKTDSTSAIVWVEVDALAAAGNTTVYMYYGNSVAITASSGVDTFIFFDDFETGSLDLTKWVHLGNALATVTGGELQIGGTGSWNSGLTTISTFARADLALETKYRWTSNNASNDALMAGWHDNGALPSYTSMPYAYYNNGNGTCTTSCPTVMIYEDGTSKTPVLGEWSQNVQYLTRVQMRASGGAIYQQSTDEGATWTTSYSGTYSTESDLRPAFSLHSGTHVMDDLRIRKATTGTDPSGAEGTEETKYPTSSTLTSNIYDATFPADWGTLTFATSGTGTVSVKVRSDSSATMATATAWASCTAIASGSVLSSNACVTNQDQYLQYQVDLVAGSSGATTPSFDSISAPLSASDQTVPITNASSVAMLKAVGGASVATNGWSNGATPYFSWTAGVDNVGGSGIKGYCLYLGQDVAGDPVTTKGNLGTSPVATEGACQFAVSSTNVDAALAGYIGAALTSSNAAYYLNIKAIDVANNVFVGALAQFQFRFDNTVPQNPTFISAPSNFVATKNVTLTWPITGGSAASDVNSGVTGLQYRIGDPGTWYGDSHSGAQDSSDVLADDGSYTTVDPIDYDQLVEGNNLVYFRTYDAAGNVATAHVSTVIKLNTASPSAPQNVTATPTTNTTNSFAFSWVTPATFQGSASNMTYCYTVNTLPTANNCTFTAAGVTSLAAGAFATQPAGNTFYLVAKDEAGNINYATAASTTFTANTSAPGVPLNPEIADISTKTTSSWKLALSWNVPSNVGAGIATYKVQRSTDNATFAQVASTAGTSYVDTSLSQITYYYRVQSCDSANNCGVFSSVTSEIPTGRFTTPAELITSPSVQVSTRTAKIVWATDRSSDSRVQIGTVSGSYQGTESAISTQAKNHEISLENLAAGTVYYYKAKWTDVDGNIGTSTELSFKTLPAPSIKDVKLRRVTLSTATLQFVATDAIKVKVFFGLSDRFGGLEEINTSTVESTYTVELAGLDDGATYSYKINTIDADGNEYDSGRIDSFSTPARPRISNLRFQPVANEPTSTQQVSWETNVPSTSSVIYSTVGVPAKESIDSELKLAHSVIIRGLNDDSIYTLVASSRDADGNLAVSDDQTFQTELDTRPPSVFDLKIETTIRGVGSDARGQLIVSWRTDEPASGQVSYGEGASGETYSSTTAEDGAFTIEHTVIISDLSTSQVYHVQATSKDKGANIGVSEDKSAIIGQASDSVIDIIFSTLEKIFGL